MYFHLSKILNAELVMEYFHIVELLILLTWVVRYLFLAMGSHYS